MTKSQNYMSFKHLKCESFRVFFQNFLKWEKLNFLKTCTSGNFKFRRTLCTTFFNIRVNCHKKILYNICLNSNVKALDNFKIFEKIKRKSLHCYRKPFSITFSKIKKKFFQINFKTTSIFF